MMPTDGKPQSDAKPASGPWASQLQSREKVNSPPPHEITLHVAFCYSTKNGLRLRRKQKDDFESVFKSEILRLSICVCVCECAHGCQRATGELVLTLYHVSTKIRSMGLAGGASTCWTILLALNWYFWMWIHWCNGDSVASSLQIKNQRVELLTSCSLVIGPVREEQANVPVGPQSPGANVDLIKVMGEATTVSWCWVPH